MITTVLSRDRMTTTVFTQPVPSVRMEFMYDQWCREECRVRNVGLESRTTRQIDTTILHAQRSHPVFQHTAVIDGENEYRTPGTGRFVTTLNYSPVHVYCAPVWPTDGTKKLARQLEYLLLEYLLRIETHTYFESFSTLVPELDSWHYIETRRSIFHSLM